MAGEIQESNPRERRRARIAHRIGVSIFFLILAAAVAGLLGKGPLSHASAQSHDGQLTVDYVRFIRYQGPVDMRIHIGAEATTTGAIELRLSNNFTDEVEIERIEPEPEFSAAGPKFVTHTIRVETNAATHVRVRFSADHFGRLAYEVGLRDGTALPLRHFAFP